MPERSQVTNHVSRNGSDPAGLKTAGQTIAALPLPLASHDIGHRENLRARTIAEQIDRAVVGSETRREGRGVLVRDARALYEIISSCEPRLLGEADELLRREFGYRLETAIRFFPPVDRIRLGKAFRMEKTEISADPDAPLLAQRKTFLTECERCFSRLNESGAGEGSEGGRQLIGFSRKFLEGGYRRRFEETPDRPGIRSRLFGLSEEEQQRLLSQLVDGLRRRGSFFNALALRQIARWLQDGFEERQAGPWNSRKIIFTDDHPRGYASRHFPVPGRFPPARETLESLASWGVLPPVFQKLQSAYYTVNLWGKLPVIVPLAAATLSSLVIQSVFASAGKPIDPLVPIVAIALFNLARWVEHRRGPRSFGAALSCVHGLVQATTMSNHAFSSPLPEQEPKVMSSLSRRGIGFRPAEVAAALHLSYSLALLGADEGEILSAARRDKFDPDKGTLPLLGRMLERKLQTFERDSSAWPLTLQALDAKHRIERLLEQDRCRRFTLELLGLERNMRP